MTVIKILKFSPAVCFALFFFGSAANAYPVCSNSHSDPDGDGWGWENNASCTVAAETGGVKECSLADSDPDGDGWGWEHGSTCVVSNASVKVVPECSDGVADYDGDGWGMESGVSCLITSGGNTGGTTNSESNATTGLPGGVQFNLATLKRVGGKGDNWCQTWAADDSVITAMSDGEWFTSQYRYHSRLYKLYGDQNNFSRQEIQNYPRFDTNDDGWFAYGIVSAGGALYSTVSKTQNGAWSEGPFRGVKLLRSYDNGASWFRVDQYNNDKFIGAWDYSVQSTDSSEMFFKEEHGRYGYGKNAYPFSYLSFVQNGQDNRASKDGYVYMYSPEGSKSNELLLARVPTSQIGQRSAWQYFSGWSGQSAQWSGDINQRRPNMYLPEKNSSGEYFGWYSWLPSVVWNPGLQLYVMVNGGTYAGHGMSNSSSDYYNKWMHTKSGSLGLWYSENPYGPWKQFFYTDHWTPDNAGNLTYQPKLSPKWMSSDGRQMTLIWSDAQRNAQGYSHSVNYKWNQMEIEIETR